MGCLGVECCFDVVLILCSFKLLAESSETIVRPFSSLMAKLQVYIKHFEFCLSTGKILHVAKQCLIIWSGLY